MAWTDEPSETQLGTIYSWLRWHMSNDEARKAVLHLKNTATRREVSYEMVRLKELKEKRLLDADTCFRSDIWEGLEL